MITAVDLFPSMIEVLRSLRHRADVEVRVIEANISDLPFDPGMFDLVMANHVLYHVPDLPGTLVGLARLLVRGGLFVATTNADNARVPVLELHREVCRRVGVTDTPDASPFSREVAGPILRRHFRSVVEHDFTKSAVPTAPVALMQSYRSTGRYQLLCRQRSQARVVRAADDILASWADQPERFAGEVKHGRLPMPRAVMTRLTPTGTSKRLARVIGAGSQNRRFVRRSILSYQSLSPERRARLGAHAGITTDCFRVSEGRDARNWRSEPKRRPCTYGSVPLHSGRLVSS